MPTTQAEPGTLTFTFDLGGDFKSLYAAEDWCAKRDLSIGRMERDLPMGILCGKHFISKWTRMTSQEQQAMHGTLTGNKRDGPVTITLIRERVEGLITI